MHMLIQRVSEATHASASTRMQDIHDVLFAACVHPDPQAAGRSTANSLISMGSCQIDLQALT